MNTPLTYSEAAKTAEEISYDEFAEFIAADDNLDVYPAPRKARRIALNAHISFSSTDRPGVGFVSFDYCNRNGYAESMSVSVGWRYNRPIFHSDKLDRTVTIRQHS